MKKQLTLLAAIVVFFAACHNSNSSTVAEKDPAYQQSMEHDTHGNKGHNESSSGSGTQTGHSSDTTNHQAH